MQLRQLLIECKRRDKLAQHNLYQVYCRKMFLLCRRYTRNDAAAEEAMMNGFLKIFRSLDRFEYVNDEAAEGWMRKIMLNESLKYVSIKGNYRLITDHEMPEPILEEDLVERIDIKLVYKAILDLATGYRTVFMLYYVEGFTHEQIAETLGIETGTSKSQLSRAKELLRQALIKLDKNYAYRRK
jgi:RNA polymerase sigma factor (sigma-70 family)